MHQLNQGFYLLFHYVLHFFGAVAIYFYLLVMHHYDNELFFDNGKSIFTGFDGFGGGYRKKNKDQDPAYKKRKLRAEIEITSNNYMKKILAKKFNKWRRAAKTNPYDTLKKAKEIYDLADLIKKIFINHLGEEFLDKLSQCKNPEKYKKSLIKIVKIRNTDKFRF